MLSWLEGYKAHVGAMGLNVLLPMGSFIDQSLATQCRDVTAWQHDFADRQPVDVAGTLLASCVSTCAHNSSAYASSAQLMHLGTSIPMLFSWNSHLLVVAIVPSSPHVN
jgi:hypothetical protein